ncbi:E3.1.11.2 [Mytilus coruscus]|uniref:exodeoxyribonuclease III n=1 Tax=Mytilus coruscus TaxID=42192 RepID=A0A6J8ES03_MYTCO|nr:E3.1.11.2 [Mytilus coruscus]
MYEGKIYECNGYNSRQGVAIMVANSVKDKTKLVYKDDEGRFIHVSYETDGQFFNFVSVYAPNNCIERARYFKFVNSYIENLQNVIIGGDFNTTLSNLDKGGKSKHSFDEAYRELNKTICNCNIFDVWRARNEGKKIFSWKRICNNILQQSRIDYFLISKSLSPNVQNVYYNETSFSDHTYVFMNFNFCVVERGLGTWVLNNTVLSNVNYVKRVKEIIVESINCSLYDSEPLIWWDNLKYRIKRYSQVFSSDLVKKKKKEFFYIQNKIQRLCALQASGIDIDVTRLETLKLDLAEPLQCMISNNCNISGINIPMSEKVCKMFQHADDTTVTVSDKKSIDEVFNVFELYGKCSGAKINRQKSEIMPIGKGCMTENKQNCHGLKICENEILLLGVYIGKNEHVCNELN